MSTLDDSLIHALEATVLLIQQGKYLPPARVRDALARANGATARAFALITPPCNPRKKPA